MWAFSLAWVQITKNLTTDSSGDREQGEPKSPPNLTGRQSLHCPEHHPFPRVSMKHLSLLSSSSPLPASFPSFQCAFLILGRRRNKPSHGWLLLVVIILFLFICFCRWPGSDIYTQASLFSPPLTSVSFTESTHLRVKWLCLGHNSP